MKRVIWFMGAMTFILQSCEEVGPAIDFSGTKSMDTTYVTTPEAPGAKRVLVEEYTGVQCVNCPDGAERLHEVSEDHPGKIIIVGLHEGYLADPLPESAYDFTNPELLTLINSYFGENPPKPAAAIDRVQQNGEYFITSRTKWPDYIQQRLSVQSRINITANPSYRLADRILELHVKIHYTEDVSQRQNLSIWMVEDHIVDAQLYPDHLDSFYEHNHVFRDFLTPVIGSSILDSLEIKEAGRVYERTLFYTVPEDWKAENCRVIIFVHNNEADDKSVEQVLEKSLIP